MLAHHVVDLLLRGAFLAASYVDLVRRIRVRAFRPRVPTNTIETPESWGMLYGPRGWIRKREWRGEGEGFKALWYPPTKEKM